MLARDLRLGQPRLFRHDQRPQPRPGRQHVVGHELRLGKIVVAAGQQVFDIGGIGGDAIGIAVIVGVGGARIVRLAAGTSSSIQGNREDHARVLRRGHHHRVPHRQTSPVEHDVRTLGRSQERRRLIALQEPQHQIRPRAGGIDGDARAQVGDQIGIQHIA